MLRATSEESTAFCWLENAMPGTNWSWKQCLFQFWFRKCCVGCFSDDKMIEWFLFVGERSIGYGLGKFHCAEASCWILHEAFCGNPRTSGGLFITEVFLDESLPEHRGSWTRGFRKLNPSHCSWSRNSWRPTHVPTNVFCFFFYSVYLLYFQSRHISRTGKSMYYSQWDSWLSESGTKVQGSVQSPVALWEESRRYEAGKSDADEVFPLLKFHNWIPGLYRSLQLWFFHLRHYDRDL